MDTYPESFGGTVKRLANEARFWTAAQLQGDGGAAEQRAGAMGQLKQELEAEGVLGPGPCQQIHDMALASAALTLCRDTGTDCLEEREQQFTASCQPIPDEVTPSLWTRTERLFMAGASLACAEVHGDMREEDRQHHLYDRYGRSVVGFGKEKGATRDAGEFAQNAAKVIPSTVVMFSGCQDSQTSADVSNTASFGLPADAGPGGAGGACTNSMVKALNEGHDLTWVTLLDRMRQILAGKYTQIPMLSSSRSMDLTSKFSVQNPSSNGHHRALLVGINYVGQKGELRGCHNDVETMKRYLDDFGYGNENMRVLMDDGHHEKPTKANIEKGMQWLVEGAKAGDSLFFHYSGHGASVRDDDGDEEDGMDETLCPLDYGTAGLLRDDECFKLLVGPLQQGVWLTCVLDCCHSGTILDLPYVFKANEAGVAAVSTGNVTSMQPNPNFDFGKLMQVVKDHPGLCAGAAAVTGIAYFVAGPEKAKSVGKTMMGVLQAEDKMKAAMSAARSVFGSLFGGK